VSGLLPGRMLEACFDRDTTTGTTMPRQPTTIAILTAMLFINGCTAADTPGDAPAATPAPGRLVIVGGGLQADNAAVYQAVLEGRLGGGPLCVLPTAGADPMASMASATETLLGYTGPEGVKGIFLSTENPSDARSPEMAADIASCSGFYFTGGVQSRVVDVFLPEDDTTLAYQALWQRWQEGAVVAGSSAGAAMMSRVMIASGGSADAVANGVATNEDGDGVHIRGGMGFFDRAFLDQHFLARGRIGRLIVSVLVTDSLRVGLGIDENTALVVDGDTAFVAGASGVVVVDGRQVAHAGPGRGTGLKVSLAGAGDALDLRTFEVRKAGTKVPLPANGEPAVLPDDPFARWAFLHLVVDLASGLEGEAAFSIGDDSLGAATLTIRKDAGFSAAMTAREGGVEETPAGLSAGPFEVDLVARGR
jgi:cyanophycinase